MRDHTQAGHYFSLASSFHETNTMSIRHPTWAWPAFSHPYFPLRLPCYAVLGPVLSCF